MRFGRIRTSAFEVLYCYLQARKGTWRVGEATFHRTITCPGYIPQSRISRASFRTATSNAYLVGRERQSDGSGMRSCCDVVRVPASSGHIHDIQSEQAVKRTNAGMLTRSVGATVGRMPRVVTEVSPHSECRLARERSSREGSRILAPDAVHESQESCFAHRCRRSSWTRVNTRPRRFWWDEKSC